MADNRIEYGFRFYKNLYGGDGPQLQKGFCATAQSFDVNNGAANVSLRRGDPVVRLSTGGFALCDGNEGAGGAVAPYGICMGIIQAYDATSGRTLPADSLPSDIAWGTNLERQSLIWVCPVQSALWEIDCDDATTATTEAAYQALLGGNANMVLAGASGESYANPRLDISTVNTTNTLVWRIDMISPTRNNVDFSGNYVKLIVKPNIWQGPEVNATGI